MGRLETLSARSDRGISDHSCARGNVFGHHGACTNDGFLADSHTAKDSCAAADACAALDESGNGPPVIIGLQFAPSVCGARNFIIDESNAVANKDFILDGYGFTDKRVR